MIYSPFKYFDFTWGSPNLLVKSGAYTSTTAFHDAWLQPFSLNTDFYRPLAESSFVLGHVIHGLNPDCRHMARLEIHATLWTWANYQNPQSAYAASNMLLLST